MANHQSRAATDGNSAEILATTQASFIAALNRYYGESDIVRLERIGGNKKTDVVVYFENGDRRRLQIKNGSSTGHHVDRRPLARVPEEIRNAVSTICLSELSTGSRPEFRKEYTMPSVEQGFQYIDIAFLGTEAQYRPQDLILTQLENGVIVKASIRPIVDFMTTVLDRMYDPARKGPQGKTIALCPEFAIQRRGGEGYHPDGRPKGQPDDIQLKLKTGVAVLRAHPFTRFL